MQETLIQFDLTISALGEFGQRIREPERVRCEAKLSPYLDIFQPIDNLSRELAGQLCFMQSSGAAAHAEHVKRRRDWLIRSIADRVIAEQIRPRIEEKLKALIEQRDTRNGYTREQAPDLWTSPPMVATDSLVSRDTRA